MNQINRQEEGEEIRLLKEIKKEVEALKKEK